MNNEFKKSKNGEYTVYTLESASGGGTSSGSIASVEMPVGGMQRRASLVTSEANKDKPTQTNPVAKAAQRVAKGSGAHKNPKKVLPRKEKHRKPMAEEWSQKYKSSINCSHPKGFSQKAHCAGKKKHDESIEMEMVCPECGMCETHGDNMMEVKQRLDAKCWKGKHKEGTKIKGGIRVNNCVPNEGVSEDHEIQMASSELQSIAKNAVHLLDLVRRYSEQEGLEAWQQSKITKAADYLNSVLQAVSGEQSGAESDLDERLTGQTREIAHKPEILSATDDGKTITIKVRTPDGTERTIANSNPAIIQQWLNVKYGLKFPPNLAKKFVGMPMSMAEGVEEGLGKMRGNPGAYDADVRASQSGMGRGPDHRGLGQELAHETNNYAVAIDGRTWKVFADKSHAQNVARSLQAKGKKATVHPTGANPSESVAEDAYMESLAGSLAEKLDPHAEPEVWVQDFQKANPNKYHQFKNKTPQKKAQMAIAARYAALEPSKKK